MGDEVEELSELEKEYRKKRNANPSIYANPVWDVEGGFQELATKLGLTDEELFKFKEVFSMIDIEHIGYLGRRNFTDLLGMLQIEVADDVMEKMFNEMDENGDGQIEFEEFLSAMVNNIGKEQLKVVDDIKVGGCGTRMWERGEIAWAANNGLIIVCCGLGIQGAIYFAGFLVALIVAYFLVFFVTPIMDVFMHRPINVPFSGGKKSCCDLTMEDENSEEDPKGRMYKSEFRRAVMGTPQGGLYDFLTTCKLPHGITLLCTIVTVFGILIGLVVMVWSETSVLLSDEDFMSELRAFVDGLYQTLNESGVNILRDRTEGYTAAEISDMLSQFNAFFGQAALIFLLWVYILSEKSERLMFGDGGENGPGILQEAEGQVTNYITLKTILSFVTGLVVAIILLVLQVKLAVMFGLLSFALNFIPNVGSMIAMFLPLPIVIVDKNLEMWQKVGAFVGPGLVQGYVGNALEPMVFGKSLNMTPLSILMALVLWSALWGIMGAILSVPLLGIQKICLTHANHPMAKYFLTLIREDPTVDENAEAAK